MKEEPTTAGGPTETDVDIARIFSRLDARDRALLWLAYVEGETHEDIATSLHVGRGSIKVLLSRARARLRELLAAHGIGEREGQ